MPDAGIVLVGGRSSRMGAAKAALEWHGSTLLRRVCGVVSRAVDGPVLVVKAPGQPLPALPPDVGVVEDPVEGLGPLQGIAVGLSAAAQAGADVAFVSSTDLPFLHPAFVRRVLAAAVDGVDVVLPVARGFRQPLAAAYRTGLIGSVERLIAAGQLKPAFLFDLDETCVAALDDAALLADACLAAADPGLDSVHNVNDPGGYAAARARPAPQVVVQRFGVLAVAGQGGARRVRAATVAAAAEAVDLELDRHVVAAVNGDRITRDPELPLVHGDTVSFLSADAGG